MIYSSQIHGPSHSRSSLTQAQEYLAGWQRARAELDNFRKSHAQDQDQQRQRLKRQLIEPLLDVADNFKAISQHLPAELHHDTWAQGVMHVVRKLDDVLSAYEVKTVGQIGEKFDPALHEAISQEKGQAPPGQVIQVISPGYTLGTLVIKPAKVKVSS